VRPLPDLNVHGLNAGRQPLTSNCLKGSRHKKKRLNWDFFKILVSPYPKLVLSKI